MLPKNYKVSNYLLQILGFIFLATVVACNTCSKPKDLHLRTSPEELTPPPVTPITQAMIEKA